MTFASLKPILLAALLASSATALLAQETTTAEDNAAEDGTQIEEETTAETVQPPAEDDPAADLSLGTEITPEGTAEPQIGQPYILQTFDDWAIRCIKAPEDRSDPCQLYQLLQDADGNNVAEVALFPLPEGSRAAAGATIVVPLETLLTEQLTMTVDGQNARRYPFTFCNAAGCVSRVGFTQAEVDQFKRGAAATIRLVPVADPSAEVVLDLSLRGFTAGFEGAVTLPE